MGWDEDSLTSKREKEKKKKHPTQKENRKTEKQTVQKPSLATSRPIPPQPLTNCYFVKNPSSPPCSPWFHCWAGHYGMEYLSGQFGPAVLAVSPPNLQLTPSCSWGRGHSRKQKALTLGKRCSAKVKTLVFHQHCFSRKSRTQHHIGCYEEN